MKFCIAGKNNIAVECTQYLIKVLGVNKKDVLACFCASDDAQDGFQKSFKKFCQQQNIASIELNDVYKLTDFIFFSLVFDQIIDVERLKTTEIFNIHFSLLPKYKGMYTSVWPLLFGETESGVTLHCIDEGIDTGDIIKNQKIPISSNDTCRTLYLKCIAAGVALFKSEISSILSGEYKCEPQEPGSGSYFSRGSLDFSNLKIDLEKPAQEVVSQIKAFSFREFQLPEIEGIPIEFAEVLPMRSRKKAGTILSQHYSYIDISTTGYDVRCYKRHPKEQVLSM